MGDEQLNIPDGLHFGLHEDIYHAIPALSSTGIKNLLISGPDFWYRTPWLNPDYADEDTDTAAKIAGRAYHTRILEGRGEFHRKYGPTFEAPPGCVRTIEDIQEVLAAVGRSDIKCKRKSEWIAAIRDLDGAVQIYDDLKERHEAQHEGKELLSGKLISRIELSAAVIEHHPELARCFTDGFPEVTAIWTQDGIRYRVRFDYLKARAFSDLKTFENYLNKPIEAAIYAAMASRKYHVQFTLYTLGADIAKTLPVFVHGNAPGPDDAWLKEFRASDEHGCYAIFQQKGIAPLARGKKFPRHLMWSCGKAAIELATHTYQTNMERFGTLPWVDIEKISDFEDEAFPTYAAEI